MESIKEFFSSIQPVVITVAVIASVVAYWWKGGNVASVEANTSLRQVADARKDEIEQLTKRVGTCEQLHRENLKEIGNLQGRNQLLEELFKNRNPETMEFMKYMTGIGQRSESFMAKSDAREDKILTALQQVSSFMGKINDHFAQNPTTVVNNTVGG